jgi:hypothetical protein
MLSLMEKQLEYKNIPWEYPLCFNEACKLRESCMHYQAYKLHPKERLTGPAVLPSAWQDGECQRYSETGLVKKAWGFSNIYNNVPNYQKAEARRRVKSYFSWGNGPYYRYHHGVNKLSPRQQEDIMQILAKYGSTDGLEFDHYEMDYDFS